jgi:hypothetical protein
MTPQEKELLSRFLQQLAAAEAGRKDTEADAMIREACARQPDAAYLLVQRTMQLEHLLQMSQTEVQKLQAQLGEARSGSAESFLGDPNAWGSSRRIGQPAQGPLANSPASLSQNVPVQGATAQAPLANSPASLTGNRAMQQPAAQAPGAAAAPARGSWSSGLFGNIASTAAGVVAGSFLFQGIQGLMHRGDSSDASGQHNLASDLSDLGPNGRGATYTRNDEPELLNTYDTPDADSSDSLFADSDDSGDFA